MEISFLTAKIGRLCNDDRHALKKLGKDVATSLRKRLDEIFDAETLETMKHLPGSCHELKGQLKGSFSVRLHGGMRLIFVPANDPLPLKEDGGLDWPKITSIQVTAIEDYHD